MMQVINCPDTSSWKSILQRPVADKHELFAQVASILQNVKFNGDTALRHYASTFDQFEPSSFIVPEADFDAASSIVKDDLKQAIDIAFANITSYHKAQLISSTVIETMPGVECWQRSVPIEKVGLYIPGGTAPLFSTLLMLGIPAVLAGCNNIIICTPPDKEDNIHPAILYTAYLLGIRSVYKVGGAQAIAAMAYGTETIPPVYKIFGPGNQYVTAAKQLVQLDGVAIDMPAGPSEVCVLADSSAEPSFIAADLLSQAEHGADSQVLLISTSAFIISNVLTQIYIQLRILERKDMAEQALHNSKAILVSNMDEGIALVNEYAPEHLIMACKDADALADKILNAGSVFMGNYSPESAGDYASGTNHTLPTNGFARAYSGVTVDSFMKKISYQKLSRKGLSNIAAAVITMAEAEGLQAHANAVKIRTDVHT